MTRNLSSFAATALVLLAATACNVVAGADGGPWRDQSGTLSFNLDLETLDPESESDGYWMGHDEDGTIGASVNDEGNVNVSGKTFYPADIDFQVSGGEPDADLATASTAVTLTYAGEELEFALEGTDECTIEIEDEDALSGSFDCDDVPVTSSNHEDMPEAVSFSGSWTGSIRTVALDE